MIKRFFLALAAFALLVITLGAVKYSQIADMKANAPQMPVMAVSTVESRTETWNPTLTGIGTLAPVEGVSLSRESEGTVVKINFKNGEQVKAGDILLELDTSVEAAQLRSTEAQLVLAQLESKRATELLEKQTISQSQLDQATAQLDQVQATVNALQAQINKKILRAPFDGRVGIRSINLGQYVSRGMPLVPLQKLDQLYVNFTLPERELPRLAVGHKVVIEVDAFPGRRFEGKLNAINPEVSASTRNVTVQALFDNPEDVLRSGMFARVSVELPEPRTLVIVPATSVAYAAYGNSIYVVEQMKDREGKEYLGVRQQFVKLGDRRGDFVAILEGVKNGEQVVSAGVFKLRNALPVKINNSIQPSLESNPKPANT